MLASAEQLAKSLAVGEAAGGTATADDDADSGSDYVIDGSDRAAAAGAGSTVTDVNSEDDAAILLALAFPDRVAQRRSRSNRCLREKQYMHSPSSSCLMMSLPLTLLLV